MTRFDPAAAAELIALAREDAGLTQAELARLAGVTQPNLASMEAGRRRPSPEMLERILRAADYRPSLPISRNSAEIRAAAARVGLANPRVFGSVIRGEDHFDSDIDLLVDAPPGTGFGPLALFADEVETLTGFPTEVHSASSASRSDFGAARLREAMPV